MTIRTTRKTVVFTHPFELKGVDRVLPPGDYRVVMDEELMDWASSPVYRRISTMIFVPTGHPSSTEMVQIDPRDLQTACEKDAQA
jgi:hypothetical protein